MVPRSGAESLGRALGRSDIVVEPADVSLEDVFTALAGAAQVERDDNSEREE